MKNKIIPSLKKNKFIVSIYQILKKRKKDIQFAISKRVSNQLNFNDLINEFPGCGLKPGDKIVVNCSLSSMGVVVGGAQTVIKALKDFITDEGLIVMPSYPHRGMYDYLENYKTFNVLTTPSQNGAITEEFRLSEGVYRSLHPTHPLCIWGKNARDISLGHENSKSPYDIHSPYKKLLDMDVTNFCIGVDFEHMIMIRVIDDLFENYPAFMYFDDKTYKVPVIGYNGEQLLVETKCHDPQKALVRHNMNLYKYMVTDIITGKLGKAKTITLSSRKMFGHQMALSDRGIWPYYDYGFIKQ